MAFLVTWLRAVLLFYRTLAPFALGITGLLIGGVLVPLLLAGLSGGLLPKLLLAKLLMGPVVWHLSEQMRPDQYWFYYNLGVPRQHLWAGVAALDGLLFLAVATAATRLVG